MANSTDAVGETDRDSRVTIPISGWHAEDVKAAIRKKGQTLSGLSRLHHLSDSYLRGTLIRRRPRGEAIIANFLGVRPADIWPERYNAVGKPLRRGAR
ncbi:MAG TPA: helix-turn-helix transcriptional regulator [Rhizomicrobium sp.]|nr:helix-turn-helix transcriptional regulator [Rhizomicrobium sp.]